MVACFHGQRTETPYRAANIGGWNCTKNMHTDCSIKSGDILQDLRPDGKRMPPLDAIAPLERRLPKTLRRDEDDEDLKGGFFRRSAAAGRAGTPGSET